VYHVHVGVIEKKTIKKCDRQNRLMECRYCIRHLAKLVVTHLDKLVHSITNPSIRNRSRTSIRWGDVKTPVRKPHSLKIASQNMHVEPCQ